MAEALARHHCGEQVAAASAGINPLGFVARETLEVLAEIGVATAGLRSKGLEEIELSQCRLAVNLTDYSLDHLLPRTFPGRLLHRPVFDPREDYRRTRDVLQLLITREISPALLADGSEPASLA